MRGLARGDLRSPELQTPERACLFGEPIYRRVRTMHLRSVVPTETESDSPTFGHRLLDRGVIEILCLSCLAVVGRATTEKAIFALEKAHNCEE